MQCFVRQSTVASPGWNTLPQNGEINDKFGTYKSLCCGAEIVINSGARFPDCPRHLNLPTIWKAIAEEKIEAGGQAAHVDAERAPSKRDQQKRDDCTDPERPARAPHPNAHAGPHSRGGTQPRYTHTDARDADCAA